MNQIEIINEDGEAILLEEAEFNSDYEPTEEGNLVLILQRCMNTQNI
jgi:hypothetical protein